jgi:heptosyltransferase-2
MYLLLTWLLAPLALLRLALSHRGSPPQNILLIQTAKIGDYICTTPLLSALRTAYPQARLSVLVNPLAEPLARHQPGVDEVITLAGGRISGFSGRLDLYRLMRRKRFDTTICISPNQAFLLVPFLAGVRWRASVLPNFGGRSYRLAVPFLNAAETHRQGRMMVETGMALLQRLGISTALPAKEIVAAPGADQRVSLAFPSLATGSWIGLGVSSGNKLKELGKDKLVELIRLLLDIKPLSGVLLIGSPTDSELAEELCRATDSSQLIDTTGRIKLEDLPALIDRLKLYVGVDSGITYLADARNIPVVDAMGPADPEDQRPTGMQAIVIKTLLPCAPCSHSFLAPYGCAIGSRACIRDLSAEKLATEAIGIWKNAISPGPE